MEKYSSLIENLWQNKNELNQNKVNFAKEIDLLIEIIEQLDQGTLRISQKEDGQWIVNEWLKKAILLYFQLTESKEYFGGFNRWYDKVPPKFDETIENEFKNLKTRIVPGAVIRKGAYVGKNTVIMPSFINIGAYVGDRTMIDSWATIGSCAQIGQNCHISGGVGIGGVLEPIQNNPVIIEDNCFIGARSEIAEGVIIEEGAVISMGVFIGASTKIIDRYSGKITYGRVPAYSVIVPGSLPNENPQLPSIYCAVIIKIVDEKTRSKTQINELLRE